MFARNNWYVAAWSNEVQDTPFARTILGTPIVLARIGGVLAAMEDRCCHRGYPLSLGRITEATLQCGYHGLRFNTEGICVKIPGQDAIPPRACVRTFPVHERNGAIWLWPGDAALADEALIPHYPQHDLPYWKWIGSVVHYEANHLLIYDNLLDLSHVGYIHGETIGGDAETHSNAQVEIERNGRQISVVRWLRDSVPPPTYLASVPFAGRVDRWQVTRFVPGLITISAGAKDVGTVRDADDFEGGYSSHSFQAITPETEHTSFYFWSTGIDTRRFGDDMLDVKLQHGTKTFEEDRVAITAQYRRRIAEPDRALVDIRADGPGLAARRIFQSMADAELARAG